MAMRTCAGCSRTRSSDVYSRREWRRGPRVGRCVLCTGGGDGASASDWVMMRDDACEAEFTAAAFQNPREGGFRRAIEGRYTTGELAGYGAIAKWPKDGKAYAPDVYTDDLRCARRAVEFIRLFNTLEIAPVPLRVIIPSMQVFGRSSPYPGRFYLREPKVSNFTNWNVNNGWNVVSTPFARAMQAFTHFTYHESDGQCIVCDIQGALYEDQAILTDLAVISHRPWAFGSTDTGAKGMVKFFSKHVCNEFCSPHWDLPVQLAADGSIINRPNPYKQTRIKEDLEDEDDTSEDDDVQVEQRDELQESEAEVEAGAEQPDELQESELDFDPRSEIEESDVEDHGELEESEVEESEVTEEADQEEPYDEQLEDEEEVEEEESEVEESDQESYPDDDVELDDTTSVDIELSDTDDQLSISSQSSAIESQDDDDDQSDFYSSASEEVSSVSSTHVSHKLVGNTSDVEIM